MAFEMNVAYCFVVLSVRVTGQFKFYVRVLIYSGYLFVNQIEAVIN